MANLLMKYGSDDYDQAKPWTFTIEDTTVVWQPSYPNLFPLESGDESGALIVEQLNAHIDNINVDEGRLFNATPTGPELVKSVTAPYTVLWAVDSFYGGDSEITYSKDAPSLEDLYGLDWDEDLDDDTIAY